MMKGLPIGLVLGVLLAFGLFRAVEHRQKAAAAARDKAASAAAVPSKDVLELAAEVDAAKKRKAKLEDELAEAESKLAAAKGGGKNGAKTAGVQGTAFRNPWSPMAKTLFRLRDKLDDVMQKNEPEYKDLMEKFVEIVTELSEEEGFTLDDFESSPYGPPMLMLTVLEGADPPVDASTLDRARDAITKAEDAWKALKNDKSDMTELERRLAGASLVYEATSGIRAALTDDQRAWFANGRMWQDTARVPVWDLGGTRESISQQMVEQWANELGIDGTTKAALAPLADDYLRRYDAMTEDFARREAAGEKVSEGEKALAKGRIAVEAQKKLRESVNLTPEQEKKLKGMGYAWVPSYTK